ncbi:MAG: hypothetical protein LBT98_04210 [Puniceicoccales bacterium]|nr:hypothetical protein [Puniceicoccales bacterium]
MTRAGPDGKKATRGDLRAAIAEASRPRGPARPFWGPCPQLRFPQLSLLRHSVGGELAKGRGSPL